MPASVVQSKLIASAPGSAPSAALDSAVTAGNALIVLVAYHSAGSSTPGDSSITVTDSRSNTWITRVEANTVGSRNRGAICDCLSPAAGATTITVTSNGPGNQFIAAIAIEVTPLTAFDQSSQQQATSTNVSTGTTAATTQADEIAFASFASENSNRLQTPAGYTSLQLQPDASSTVASSHAYRILSAIGAQSASFTASGSTIYGAAIATYKAATGGGGGTVNTKVLTSTIDVTEGPTIRSALSNIMAEDEISVTDEASRHALRGRVATDTISVSDSALWFMLRHRLLESGISISDSLLSSVIGNNVFTKVLTSELLLSDAALPTFQRNRLLESDLSVVDDVARWMLRYRLAESGISLSDSVLSQIIGGNIFFKVLTSQIATADEVLKALLISRTLTDAIATDDSGLTALQRFILLSDALSVDDSLVSQFVPSSVFTPRIVIGADQPKIELGMDSVCVVGADQPSVVLGGSAV